MYDFLVTPQKSIMLLHNSSSWSGEIFKEGPRTSRGVTCVSGIARFIYGETGWKEEAKSGDIFLMSVGSAFRILGASVVMMDWVVSFGSVA
ncbi:hypothetical protein PM082_018125 [Marasmius tenuissimus]|nr:hypothetical protein PM082_018125 [Marasmius tenuissimus]